MHASATTLDVIGGRWIGRSHNGPGRDPGRKACRQGTPPGFRPPDDPERLR